MEQSNEIWIFGAVDETVGELCNTYEEDLEKENFLYSVTETEEPSTSVQIEVYNTKTNENCINNDDQKNESRIRSMQCNDNQKKSRWETSKYIFKNKITLLKQT